VLEVTPNPGGVDAQAMLAAARAATTICPTLSIDPPVDIPRAYYLRLAAISGPIKPSRVVGG
jgi:hypothetical protein